MSAIAAIAALGTLAACGGAGDATGPGSGGGGGGGGGGGVASVGVSPSSASITAGATTTLTATPLDASGNAVSGATVTWSTSDAAIATVSSAGVVTGVAPGTATITATSGTVKGSSTITVTPVPVASVTLSANKTTIYAFVADSLNLGRATITATMKDAAGNTLSGRAVTWTSSKPTVATVSSTGVVDAIAPGTTTITATSEGKSATIDITVTMSPVAKITVSPVTSTIAVGQSEDLDVHMYDAQGNELVGVSHGQFGRVIQVVVNPTSGIITVTSGNHITGAAKGSATVTYSIDSASVTATVTVN